MQIKNFNIAATLTPGTNNSNNNRNSFFDAKVAESGFASLMRQQNLAAKPNPVRAPAPAPAQFSASITPPPPAPAPAPAPPPPPARLPAPAPPAASLRASQSTPVNKAPPPTPTSTGPSTPASSLNTRASQIGAPARTADKSSPAKASHASRASAETLVIDKTRKAETPEEGDEAVNPDPTFNQHLADLRLPAKPASTAPGAAEPNSPKPGAGGPAATDNARDTSAKLRAAEHTLLGNEALKNHAELPDQPARDRIERSASLPASDFAAAFAELRSVMSPAEQPAAASDITAAAAAAASGAAFKLTSGTTREVASAQAVNLSTPVSAPDFAHQLGAQLSVLARDGVQQAELHLNPADMGPVSVHITMDGTQAHIDFGADVATTRQVIEAGMPELASALADAGFTLAGGGVSQHSRGRSEGGRGESGSGSGARRVVAGSTETTPASRMMRRTVSAGGVDIYA